MFSVTVTHAEQSVHDTVAVNTVMNHLGIEKEAMNVRLAFLTVKLFGMA